MIRILALAFVTVYWVLSGIAADAGGGYYSPPEDTDAFSKTYVPARDTAAEQKHSSRVLRATQVPATTKTKSRRVRIAGPGKVMVKAAPWVKWPPHYWALIDAKTGDLKAKNTCSQIRMRTGDYQVAWCQDQHTHEEIVLSEIRVKPGKTSRIVFNTGIGLRVPEGIEPPDWWALATTGNKRKIATFKETLEPQLVPAGRYELLWRQRNYGSGTTSLGTVDIMSGRLNEISVDSGFALHLADWVEHTPFYYVLINSKGEKVGTWNFTGPQLMSPGKYMLVYRPTEHGHQDIIWGRINIPKHGVVPVRIDSGIRFIHEQGSHPPYRVFFVDIDTKQEFVMGETWDTMPLPPGWYRMDWWQKEHGSQRETLVDEFVVESGTLVEMEI